MRKTIKLAIIIFIAAIILPLAKNKTFAVQIVSEDIQNIDTARYPGFKERIQQLQNQYPNWKFKLLYTGLDWNEVIANEYVGHGTSPKNLVYKRANYDGQWICSICGDTHYDNGYWRCASEQAIKYMMDARNSINISDVFQFEELTSIGYDIEILRSMTNGTFLAGHEQGIVDTANTNNVNPYYLVARLLQEQGTSGTVLTAGNGYAGQYVGFYNAFNIAASGNSTEEIILNALAYAKKKGWTSLDQSINEGISFLANQYIKSGQNTLYLQKFDVEQTNGYYSNQYMQNVMAAQSEGAILRNTYVNTGIFLTAHAFVIPIFENMPAEVSARPDSTISSSTDIDIVKVNVNSSIRLRNVPNGDVTVGYLYAGEIVTRLEKATEKINKTYWDKVQKADGTIGYAARETYEDEASYKLYLVPLSDNSSNNNSGNNQAVQESKVVIDEENKIIKAIPNVTAQDVINVFGESIKIVRADGNYLSGADELVGTGYIVNDQYTIIKMGDCNGDGKVSPSDYIFIKNQILKENILNQNQQIAADANRDGKISPSDYVLVKNNILYGTQI